MRILKRFFTCALCLCFMALPAWAEEAHPDAKTLTDALYALESSETPSFEDFQTIALDGQTVDEGIFADHELTMINIWATFCGPCLSEMPDLATLADDYEEGQLQVVGIVIDVLDTDGSVAEDLLDLAWDIVDETGASYPHLLPSYDLIAAKLYTVTGVPETVFVDETGRVLSPDTPYIGARSREEWKQIINGLLAELESA